jgi:hypothetical protein
VLRKLTFLHTSAQVTQDPALAGVCYDEGRGLAGSKATAALIKGKGVLVFGGVWAMCWLQPVAMESDVTKVSQLSLAACTD